MATGFQHGGPQFDSLENFLFRFLRTDASRFHQQRSSAKMEEANNFEDWPLYQSWVATHEKMTSTEITEAVIKEDWIWFDNITMYGSSMCIHSRDAFEHIGPTIQTLLDHAVKDGNKYTLTNRFLYKGNVGRQVQMPWSAAYSDMSQFAEWGYQGAGAAYWNIHRLKIHGNKSWESGLQKLLDAGVKFSHIILVEEERIGEPSFD